jgi:tetratricopeptide (TPR) repeat protein
LHMGSGDVLAAMETMELATALRAVQFGVAADPQYCRTDHGCVDEADIVELVVAYNTAAVEGLGPGQHARDTLWKAELLCAESKLIASSKSQIKLRATTLNNLACCYRGMNQPHAALKYWKQTLSLQEGLGGSTLEFQRAGTHLNLAELYASTRYHHGAVRHAQTAVGYLLRRFQLGSTRPGGAVGGGAAGLSREDVRSLKQQATTAPRRRKLALLVAALDRLASSLLGMRRRAEASLATQTAAILREALVGDSPTTHVHRQARPGSLPALEHLGDSAELQKRRHSSAAISRASAPPDSSVHLPALQRYRFP